ncbi:MAG: hypothetical protein AABX03_03445 [Nanoarchaeota archaeon]
MQTQDIVNKLSDSFTIEFKDLAILALNQQASPIQVERLKLYFFIINKYLHDNPHEIKDSALNTYGEIQTQVNENYPLKRIAPPFGDNSDLTFV